MTRTLLRISLVFVICWSTSSDRARASEENASAPSSWTRTEVAPLDSLFADHYADTGVAVTSDGFVHLSYRDTGQDLAHATNENGPWQTRKLLSWWRPVARENAIVVDGEDRPHISTSFSDGTDEDLRYLTRSGEGIWSVQSVFGTQSVGLESSLALAPDGTAHLSHWRWNTSQLLYSENTTGGWQTTSLASASWDRTAIAVDSLGVVHFVYRSGSALFHRTSSDPAETIDTGLAGSNAAPRMALDSAGNLHVVYEDSPDLLYASNASGSWQVETVASGVQSGRDHDLALGLEGDIHVSYRNGAIDALVHAERVGGRWVETTVDALGDTGRSTAIDIDRFGSIHVSYRRNGPGAPVLIYATDSVCRGEDGTGDDDGDGICGNLDRCEGFDDGLDQDGDGVPDGCDRCPGFDDGLDEDGDGVPDGCDRCPGFDDSLDGDGDGVADGCDLCTGDDASGDADGDGTCNDLDPPHVQLGPLPAYGTNEDLSGHVVGADAATHHLATYLFLEGGGWWSKPSFAKPCTAPAMDGSFSVDVTTGGCDAYATKYAVFLLPASEACPQANGAPVLPEALGQTALTSVRVERNPYLDQPLLFSGRQWVRKEALCPAGPGGNYFAPELAWTDSDDVLHLALAEVDGQWRGSEVISNETLGYGQYRVFTSSRLDRLDPRAVFGIFLWDGEAPPDFREMDIEYTRWSNPEAASNAQFVVQPYTDPDNLHTFSIDLDDGEETTTHIIDWSPERVEFSVYRGHQGPTLDPSDRVASWTRLGPSVPDPGAAELRMNLWLHGGEPPLEGRGEEIRIERFEFVETFAFGDDFETGTIDAWDGSASSGDEKL